MATYKLIQDIEAEDHILGPLTLRQFLFGLSAAFLYYACFISITKHFAFMLAVFVPPALFCTFFAVPFGMDQPTEVWALAKIRYFFKPRIRVWNQSGIKEFVTITAPKRLETLPATKGFTQTEVRSRLKALADTIDSRGWAVKNVNPYVSQAAVVVDSDRLLDLSSLPQSVPEIDATKTEDVLDETSSPLAQQFDTMMTKSTQEHRQQLMDQLNDPAAVQPAAPAPQPQAADNYWFMQAADAPQAPALPATPAPSATSLPEVTPSPSEAALSEQLRARHTASATPYGHLRTLQPIGNQPAAAPTPVQPPAEPSTSTMTTAPDPDILTLANNNDLNVTALAHEAERAKQKKQEPPEDEVVISLR